MPTAMATPQLPTATPTTKWKRPAKTTHDLPWADIVVLDMNKYDLPGGKQALAEELRDAVHTTGFFALVNTSFTPEEIQQQYDLAQAFFALPAAVKGDSQYLCDFAKGNYFGYKPPHEKKIYGTDVLDNVELLNIPKFNAHSAAAHEPFHPSLDDHKAAIEAFSKKSLALAAKILTLLALILELPPDYFSSRHLYESASEDHLRYMRYHPRPAAADALVSNTWTRAHTDFGSLTLLWSQDVAGLQIKTTKEGEWKYVRPVDGGVVCNIGDTVQFWSKGYLKSTTHRVVRPPEDQAGDYRLGLLYFVRPGNEVDIRTAPSPLLTRLRLVKGGEEGGSGEGKGEAVKGLEYVRERVRDYHDHGDYSDRKGKTFKVGDLEIEDEAA